MAYTSHGHHIPGTTEDVVIPFGRMRCGGPAMCKTCRNQALQHTEYAALFKPPATTQAASGDILKMAAEVIDEDDMREHYVQLAESQLDQAEDVTNSFDYDDETTQRFEVKYHLARAQVYATMASAYRGS